MSPSTAAATASLSVWKAPGVAGSTTSVFCPSAGPTRRRHERIWTFTADSFGTQTRSENHAARSACKRQLPGAPCSDVLTTSAPSVVAAIGWREESRVVADHHVHRVLQQQVVEDVAAGPAQDAVGAGARD